MYSKNWKNLKNDKKIEIDEQAPVMKEHLFHDVPTFFLKRML